MVSAVWKHVRAVVICLHASIVLLAALPSLDGAMDRSLWKHPQAQEELGRWAATFRMPLPAFEDWLWGIASGWMEARETFMSRIRPYVNKTSTQQPWRMFVSANRFPKALQIQVHDRPGDDGWTTLFERDNAAFRWNAVLFEQERFRNGLDRLTWPQYRAEYERFCRYFGAKALSEHPAATEARCRFWRAPVLSPEAARDGTPAPGTWESEYVYRRPGAPR